MLLTHQPSLAYHLVEGHLNPRSNNRGCVNTTSEVSCCWTGLTKVPIDGQPRSIVRDLEDMARTYIKVSSPSSLHRTGASSPGLEHWHAKRHTLITKETRCNLLIPVSRDMPPACQTNGGGVCTTANGGSREMLTNWLLSAGRQCHHPGGNTS